jgi:hypothetical protein
MKPPQISERTISAIQLVITGNETRSGGVPLAPYRSGPELFQFFNEFGFNDQYSYGGGAPSRWAYADGRIRDLNGTLKVVRVIEDAVDPAHFLGTEFEVVQAVEHLNTYLKFEGYELRKSGARYKLYTLGDRVVHPETVLAPARGANSEFVREQVEKCNHKLADGDYDGAITNARSLLEAVLTDIERQRNPAAPPYDGDLGKLFKRVRALLNLEPTRTDISDTLRQLLSGLISVVQGLAPLRNKMSDSHVREYRPDRHHAKLAVNAAITVADFVLDSLAYQQQTGRLP